MPSTGSAHRLGPTSYVVLAVRSSARPKARYATPAPTTSAVVRRDSDGCTTPQPSATASSSAREAARLTTDREMASR